MPISKYRTTRKHSKIIRKFQRERLRSKFRKSALLTRFFRYDSKMEITVWFSHKLMRRRGISRMSRLRPKRLRKRSSRSCNRDTFRLPTPRLRPRSSRAYLT